MNVEEHEALTVDLKIFLVIIHGASPAKLCNIIL